jgi:hypothetical protein
MNVDFARLLPDFLSRKEFEPDPAVTAEKLSQVYGPVSTLELPQDEVS